MFTVSLSLQKHLTFEENLAANQYGKERMFAIINAHKLDFCEQVIDVFAKMGQRCLKLIFQS
jgi:hypothetical protein